MHAPVTSQALVSHYRHWPIVSLGCCLHEDCRPPLGSHVSAVGYKPCNMKVQPLPGSTPKPPVNKNGVQSKHLDVRSSLPPSKLFLSHASVTLLIPHLTFCTFYAMFSMNEQTKVKETLSTSIICSMYYSSTCILVISEMITYRKL